jgi:hypothetical protein
LKDAVTVNVERLRDAATPDDLLQDEQGAEAVFLLAEDRPQDRARGVVDHPDQRQLRPVRPEPAVAAAIRLEQHPFLGAPLPPPVPVRWPAGPGGGDPGAEQHPAHRRAAQADAFPLRQELGEVLLINPCIRASGQGDDARRHRRRHGPDGGPTAIAMHQARRPRLPIGRLQPLHLPHRQPKRQRAFLDRRQAGQHLVQHQRPSPLALSQTDPLRIHPSSIRDRHPPHSGGVTKSQNTSGVSESLDNDIHGTAG